MSNDQRAGPISPVRAQHSWIRQPAGKVSTMLERPRRRIRLPERTSPSSSVLDPTIPISHAMRARKELCSSRCSGASTAGERAVLPRIPAHDAHERARRGAHVACQPRCKRTSGGCGARATVQAPLKGGPGLASALAVVRRAAPLHSFPSSPSLALTCGWTPRSFCVDDERDLARSRTPGPSCCADDAGTSSTLLRLRQSSECSVPMPWQFSHCTFTRCGVPPRLEASVAMEADHVADALRRGSFSRHEVSHASGAPWYAIAASPCWQRARSTRPQRVVHRVAVVIGVCACAPRAVPRVCFLELLDRAAWPASLHPGPAHDLAQASVTARPLPARGHDAQSGPGRPRSSRACPDPPHS